MTLLRRAAVALAIASAACHPSVAARVVPAMPEDSRDEAGPIASQAEWWRAFADGDTAALQERSGRAVALTLSNARTFDRAAMLAESRRLAPLPHPTLEWPDTKVLWSADGQVVLVAARLRESIGRNVSHNRTLTVLERADDVMSGWRVIGAHSTREPERYSRLSAAVAGDLSAYAGRYRVPAGVVTIALQDSALALTDPRGGVTRLEPVGPGLFEGVPPPTSNEVVHLIFTRDESGRVIALSRLGPGGITTFPRVSDR